MVTFLIAEYSFPASVGVMSESITSTPFSETMNPALVAQFSWMKA